jgi:hypothetical protein
MVFHGDAPLLLGVAGGKFPRIAPRIASTCTQHREIRLTKSSMSEKKFALATFAPRDPASFGFVLL